MVLPTPRPDLGAAPRLHGGHDRGAQPSLQRPALRGGGVRALRAAGPAPDLRPVPLGVPRRPGRPQPARQFRGRRRRPGRSADGGGPRHGGDGLAQQRGRPRGGGDGGGGRGPGRGRARHRGGGGGARHGERAGEGGGGPGGGSRCPRRPSRRLASRARCPCWELPRMGEGPYHPLNSEAGRNEPPMWCMYIDVDDSAQYCSAIF
mmetsp:Transcript_20116/g.44037  ORF Transcript_20116/g.44037 Transcript_20116/m.44037 type:complete len:205 (+) Transcript_20116:577-1191(+)